MTSTSNAHETYTTMVVKVDIACPMLLEERGTRIKTREDKTIDSYLPTDRVKHTTPTVNVEIIVLVVPST